MGIVELNARVINAMAMMEWVKHRKFKDKVIRFFELMYDVQAMNEARNILMKKARQVAFEKARALDRVIAKDEIGASE